MTTDIVVSSADGICTIRINRPAKKNALTVAMYEAMHEALRAAAADPAVRVIVFCASGDNFTAGNDLGDFMQRPPTGDDSPVARFLAALATAHKPLLAAVDGKAIGLGVTMLLHCDLVYASTRAQFQTPFVRLGLVPEAASSLLLPRLVGHQRAAEMLLLCDYVDAATMHALGLVNAVVAPEALEAHVAAVARRLAEQPPTSVRLTKALLKDTSAATVTERMQLEGAHFTAQLASAELREAITAFFEKRKPDFSKL